MVPERNLAMKPFACGVVTLGLLVGGVREAEGQQSYIYTTLDVPRSEFSFARGINNAGQIAGGYVEVAHNYGFLFSGSGFTKLDVPGSTSTAANGVNDAGQVVGYGIDNHTTTHGFLLSGGRYTILDVPGSVYTEANGINNSGQVVGFFQR